MSILQILPVVEETDATFQCERCEGIVVDNLKWVCVCKKTLCDLCADEHAAYIAVVTPLRMRHEKLAIEALGKAN